MDTSYNVFLLKNSCASRQLMGTAELSFSVSFWLQSRGVMVGGGCCSHHLDPINTGTPSLDWCTVSEQLVSGPAQAPRCQWRGWKTRRSPRYGPKSNLPKGSLCWVPSFVLITNVSKTVWLPYHYTKGAAAIKPSHYSCQMWALGEHSMGTGSQPSSPHPLLPPHPTPQDGPRGDSGWESPGHWPQVAKV